MSKILIETRLNSLKLNEQQTARKGCLGRIEGICADYANPTRNGRFYSRELWENVFNNDLIKESLEAKTLIGELDHPEDRFEPLAKEACVVMTDYKFDDDKKVVTAGFDILDTPSGNILKSLLDYGCVMGVSSRGQGDIISNGDYEEVAPDTYEFACFDVVTTPAVATARQHVTESKESKQKLKGLNASIIEQVNNSTTNAELDTILRVVESTGLSNLASVKDAIRNKRKSISEVKTISEKTMNDLREAKKQIKRLEKENENLSSKTISEQKEFNSTSSNLASQVMAYKHREGKLVEEVASLNTQLKKQNETLHSKRVEVAENRKEISNLKNENSDLQSKVSESAKKCDKVKLENKKLESQLKENSTTIKTLMEELDKRESKISELNESLKLTENKLKSEKENSTTTLNESKRTLNESSKTLELFKESFIESICGKYGIDVKNLTESVSKHATPSEIEKTAKTIIERQDRYSSLPFSTNSSSTPVAHKILSENLKSFDYDDDFEESRSFIETVSGQMF